MKGQSLNKIRIVILAIILIALAAIVLYFVLSSMAHTQPRPLLNSDKEINQITVTYENPTKNESQAIYNFDKAALIKYLSSCEMKWLHSESVLSSGDYEFCITIEETDGVSTDFLFIFLGELNIVGTSNNATVNNVYEIINGHDVLDKVRELMGVEAKNFN